MKTRASIITILAANLMVLNLNGQVTTLTLWTDGIPGSIRNATYVEASTVTDGVIGFSSGGHLASTLSTHFD